MSHKKSIRVNDRATLFNLLIGLNGYTISTGVLSADLNGNEIIPIPLDCEETIKSVGFPIEMLRYPSSDRPILKHSSRQLPNKNFDIAIGYN